MVEDKEQKNIESFISENNFDDLEKILGHIKQRYRLGIFVDFAALGFITLGVLSLHIDLYKNIVPTSSSTFLIILGIVIQIFLLIENSTIKRDYYKKYQAINDNLKKNMCYFIYCENHNKKWRDIYNSNNATFLEVLDSIKYIYIQTLIIC